MHDELDLLARARALEEQALATIHDIYYGPLFRYILMRVGNPIVAEDLTAEVFVRFLTALRAQTAPDHTLRGWLYAVASNLVNDYFRHYYQGQQVQLDESIAGDQGNPAESASAALRSQEILAALAELTTEQQEVIALRFGQELSVREVAGLLNKSEGAVKQLQARALAALGQRLGRRE